ncbi:Formylglycine-generating enzyme, required for sulfatase activity, contains SUMF1/FGE domain [Sphingobium faniae]|nr:Formylglycine-generating enzyme, required for sulfatase activity, contains SUMF1/FGE domain [Sphingobium faniae]
MAFVPGGSFLMGSNDHYPEERPARSSTVDAFLMDRTPVTNAQFARFVAATGHVTFAEIAPDPRDYPGMDPALAVPGSIVFVPPSHPVRLADGPNWWRFVTGADWRHPSGPGSSIDMIPDHPVVHIGYTDALAYAAWVGKQLPTEAEWERAARGGLEGAAYAWGDDFMPGGTRMTKTWEGHFPHDNRAAAGLERTAPVASYPANGFGLFDMIGNVWEWTDEAVAARGESGCCAGLPAAAQGGPQERVLKGGSHMCAPEYCQRYRPAARWLQPIDTTTSHVGFRCIRRLDLERGKENI